MDVRHRRFAPDYGPSSLVLAAASPAVRSLSPCAAAPSTVANSRSMLARGSAVEAATGVALAVGITVAGTAGG